MIYAPPYDFYSTEFINYYNKTYFYQFVNLVFKQMWELNRLFKWISWFFKISTFYWSKLILSIIAFSNFFFWEFPDIIIFRKLSINQIIFIIIVVMRLTCISFFFICQVSLLHPEGVRDLKVCYWLLP